MQILKDTSGIHLADMTLPEATPSKTAPVQKAICAAVLPEAILTRTVPEPNHIDDLAIDSDATIIYDPEEYCTKRCRSEFRTKTRGIKITKCTHMYACPVCGIKKKCVQSVNEHYKRHHKKVKCKLRGKVFNTASSKDKHMYNHKRKK